jgi:hypothetical protein
MQQSPSKRSTSQVEDDDDDDDEFGDFEEPKEMT